MCRPKLGVQVEMEKEGKFNFKPCSFDLIFKYKIRTFQIK